MGGLGMTRWTIPLLVLGWGSGTSQVTAEPPAGDSAQLLAVAANGYRANLEAFEYLTCRYTVTWGFAKSLDDAVAGRLEPNPRIAPVVYYKNGPTIRYRIEEDAATKATLDKPLRPEQQTEFAGLKSGPIVPFTTTDYVLSERHGLLYDPRGHTANIYDGGTKKWKSVDGDYLLSMLLVNTEYDFGLLADRAARGEIRTTPEPAGEGGIKTTFRLTQDPIATFAVDSARGFLPTRIEKTYKKGQDREGTSYVVVPRIRSCSKGRWFPEKVVTYMKQFPTQSPCLTRVFTVTELDADHRPPKEAFTLDLPAGTVILQFDNSFKNFRTKQPETIGPDDLDRIHQLTEEVPRVPQTDTAIVVPRRYTWAWYAAGGSGLLLAGYLGRRYFSARRGHAPT